MKFNICEIDLTPFLYEDIKKATGELTSIYLYAPEEEVYCCELTPSHWLEAVAFCTEKDIDDDLWEGIQRELYDWSHYRHCRSVKHLPNALYGEFDDLEEAREHFQGNPTTVEFCK